MPLVYERKGNYVPTDQQTNELPFPCTTRDVDCEVFSTMYMLRRLVLKLLKSRDTISMLHLFIT